MSERRKAVHHDLSDRAVEWIGGVVVLLSAIGVAVMVTMPFGM